MTSAVLSLDEINEHTHAAVAAYHAADKTTARALCEAIVASMPNHPYALNLLAVMSMDAGHFDAALDLFDSVLTAHPQMEQAQANVRVCVERMGRFVDESDEDYYLRQLKYAKRFVPLRHADHWLRAALHYFYTGRIQEAVAVYHDALAHGIAHEAVYGNLGAHQQDLGDWAAAETAYRQAIALNPSFAGALYNLGHLLSLQHRHKEAETLLRAAIEVQPDYADAYIGLGHLLGQESRLEEAMQCFDRAAQLTPSSALPASARLFNLAYDSRTTAADMLACAQEATRHYATTPALSTAASTFDKPIASPDITPTRPRASPIRVGFVSGDFKDHPVGYFTENLLRHINRERFEWHIFSNFEASDAIANNLRQLATSWTVIANQSDAFAKQAIADKAIDVLFDLSGHTALHRLPLFAARAAPVQITWLGWHDTTGLANMDYLLTDRATLDGLQQSDGSFAMTEEPLLLPHTRLCMMPPSGAPEVSPLPAQRNGFITFGAMQILAKISDETLTLWANILTQTPSTKLLIRTKQFREPEVFEDFTARAQAFGLPMNRVSLLAPLGREDYLASFANIDIMLDTTPYPGGTTTAEALWMGVPTITLAGKTMISRQGAGLLTAAGLQNWIAESHTQYIAIAAHWSTHISELAALRAGLRTQVANTALFDGAQFARDFEGALLQTL